jgi:hypothetical protein
LLTLGMGPREVESEEREAVEGRVRGGSTAVQEV